MANLRDTARRIFDQSLADCSVERAVARHVSIARESLATGRGDDRPRGMRGACELWRSEKPLAPCWFRCCNSSACPSHCDLAGVLIAPEESHSAATKLPGGIQFFAGGHPSPNDASFAGARAALTMLRASPRDATANSLCLFLISGGASAMMELPLDPSISLADTASFHRALVGSGASITEINCVRKHFSAVKGGRLAQAAGNAICRSLLLSDVPVGREDALGSGPTIPDSSTVEECREILERYQLLAQFPAAVRQFFESDALVETPKPGGVAGSSCGSVKCANPRRSRGESLQGRLVIFLSSTTVAMNGSTKPRPAIYSIDCELSASITLAHA